LSKNKLYIRTKMHLLWTNCVLFFEQNAFYFSNKMRFIFRTKCVLFFEQNAFYFSNKMRFLFLTKTCFLFRTKWVLFRTKCVFSFEQKCVFFFFEQKCVFFFEQKSARQLKSDRFVSGHSLNINFVTEWIESRRRWIKQTEESKILNN
jgi:hypothetical protein